MAVSDSRFGLGSGLGLGLGMGSGPGADAVSPSAATGPGALLQGPLFSSLSLCEDRTPLPRRAAVISPPWRTRHPIAAASRTPLDITPSRLSLDPTRLAFNMISYVEDCSRGGGFYSPQKS
ncbi:hypothetical protein T310_8269 [Rasamsonia emersonii CBS 393.64]|uniref:Uncharacterized protein n=1 Tax=Rasamsonia emersonii (strain ATCC 16479 / CBS 393.64 / IMI 116815) TaxID=1408163 RepID=A0A0F4YJM9_RASE3|nr:hypothetical protein T310_8269 [Rasamsonia emersonii CBS 393.64]KKA17793.1 hypothetical protein T310_8269 [Rasamsonia emersonii CBS 393.64]